MTTGSSNFHGDLQVRKLPAPRAHTARSIRIPGLGRVIFTRDPGESNLLSREVFMSHLTALHRDGDGQLCNAFDFGSGLVTNLGVASLANDCTWATGTRTIKNANQHATGTGTTAAAATDITLQTLAAPTATTAVAGAQTFVSNPNSQVYKTVATISYVSSLAITEWGLFTGATLSATTGTPATAVSSTSLTATGTPYTASTSSVQGQEMFVVKTGTTLAYMLICANTTSVLSGAGDPGATNTANNGATSWYKVSDGTASSTPGSTEAFTIQPVMWDHKVFSAINVNSGDSIQFSYSLTVQSGG